MALSEAQLAGSTDMQRAGLTSDRAKLMAGDATPPDTGGNAVKEQLVRNDGIDALAPKWEDVCDATHAAREACDSLLEANPKADPEATFTSIMTDLIEVLTELRDGTAGNIFDEMSDQNGDDSSDSNDS